jgi:hypothetical protein
MKHPYDGPGTCVMGAFGALLTFFGGCLTSTIFFVTPNEENIENGLATAGIVLLLVGILILFFVYKDLFKREEIKDHEQADCLSLREIANKYWEDTVNQNLSKWELSKLHDGIYTDGGFVYHLELANGQYYEGIPVYYSVYVDCYGEINAAGYHLAQQGITYEEC